MAGIAAIRRGELADASSLAALSIEVWLGTYIREGINAFFADHALNEFTTRRLCERLADPMRTILVSQNAAGIDGMIELVFGSQAPVDDCPDIEIATLYVQPRHQGAGKGVALLDAGCDRAKTAGGTGVWLAVNAENRVAMTFYERWGFFYAGQTHYQIKDEFYLNHVMCRNF